MIRQPGWQVAAEMAEQPNVIARLLDRQPEVAATAASVMPMSLSGMALVARGSSDNVAVHARYMLEAVIGRPVSLVAPSLHTLYNADVDYSGQLVIAISQSGATPEIVTVLDRLRSAGAKTLAVTNDPASELAQVAHGVVCLEAGAEVAVPATKTVTAQFVALALIARSLAPGRVPFTDHDLAALPDTVASVLADTAPIETVAERVATARTVFLVARGYLYAAALESALKVRESAGIAAEGWSAADLRHGPIAAVDAQSVVLGLTADGPGAADVAELLCELSLRGISPMLVADVPGADLSLPPLAEALAVIPAVVRGQQVALATALRRGVDPDTPFGMSKITAT